MQNLDKLKAEILGEIAAAKTPDALEALRISALGKKGSITELIKELGALGP